MSGEENTGESAGYSKRFEDLSFTDDYIFKLVMERHDVFRAVLSVVLPEIEVETLASLESEKPFTLGYFLHGARFDIIAKGSKTFLDVEMQVCDEGESAERSLFYLGLLISMSLKKGESYKSLPESCVIFFCKFDPFKRGLPVYTFSLTCGECEGLSIEGRARIMLFNAAAWQKAKTPKLQSLLRFILTGEASSEETKLVLDAVIDAKKDPNTKGGWGMLQDQMIAAERRGEKRGERRGEKRGAREKAVETARNLFGLKLLTPEQIAQATGLSHEEVQSLAQGV